MTLYILHVCVYVFVKGSIWIEQSRPPPSFEIERKSFVKPSPVLWYKSPNGRVPEIHKMPSHTDGLYNINQHSFICYFLRNSWRIFPFTFPLSLSHFIAASNVLNMNLEWFWKIFHFYIFSLPNVKISKKKTEKAIWR